MESRQSNTKERDPVSLIRYGVVMANLGDYANPQVAVRIAQEAETAGWEAFFVWDHLGFVWRAPSCDPWVVLSAVANSTTRLTLGTAITPLARRRAQVVANALTSLDLLSGGRVVFGAGLGGATEEFTAFGEPGAEQALVRRDGDAPRATLRRRGRVSGSTPSSASAYSDLDRRRKRACVASCCPLGRMARAYHEPRRNPNHG